MTQLENYKTGLLLVADINAILNKNGIIQKISILDISVTDNTVSDLGKPEHVLSNLIIDSIWPPIKDLVVFHYTTKSSAESILNSSEFRFYSLLKRFTENEIETFCINHKLDGYLKITNGEPEYKTLIMNNTYYASFTDTNLTEEQEWRFWKNFGHGNGVRIKFKITASNSNFRKMVYEGKKGKPIKLLNDLSDHIKQVYKRDFVLSGQSRLSAFYLPNKYEYENEYRVLYRLWDGLGPKPKTDGKHQYIGVPIGIMSDLGYQIDVEEIQSDENLNIPSHYSVLPRGE